MNETFLAGDAYRDLRSTLMRYLQGLGSHAPEDIADETIVRVLQKVKVGQDVRDMRAYVFGVARNVFFEYARHPRTVTLSQDLVSNSISEDAELLDNCLTECLQKLPSAERKITKAYYKGEGQKLIENRSKLAKKLGISLDSLRIRVHRNRAKLAKCMEECAGRIDRT